VKKAVKLGRANDGKAGGQAETSRAIIENKKQDPFQFVFD